MLRNNKLIKKLLLFSLLLMIPLIARTEKPLESAIELRLEGQQETLETQREIDQLSNQTLDMVQEYQQVIVQQGDLKVYNDQLEKLVFKQREKLDSFKRQLQNAKEAQRTIVPMMLRMVKVLSRFIQLDTPFLEKERSMRIVALKEMLDDPAISAAEKYRRILEAYQIEADYGRTLESYTGDIEVNGEKRAVDFLRVGRLALLYLTLDGSECGFWNKKEKKWQPLSDNYNKSIAHAIRIARKEAPPDLIIIPLLIPESFSMLENKGGQK